VEPLNTIVNVFSVFLGCRVARLVFEVASVAVLEQEPRFPLFEHVFVLFGSATDAIAEWVEDVEFWLVEVTWVALCKPTKGELGCVGCHASGREQQSWWRIVNVGYNDHFESLESLALWLQFLIHSWVNDFFDLSEQLFHREGSVSRGPDGWSIFVTSILAVPNEDNRIW